MRVRLKGNPLWKWWWPLGGIAVAALFAVGAITDWSGALWAAAGVAAVVYVGVPVMAAALGDLTGKADPEAANSQPGSNPLVTPDSKAKAEVPEPPPEVTVAAQPHAGGTMSPSRGIASPNASQTAAPRPDTASPGPPSRSPEPPTREELQRRIAAMSGPPARPPERPGDRPWRKVGSREYSDLVWALSKALKTVSQANSTAALAGVTMHLVMGGQNNTVQRWQAVLAQAIDDEVDDALCSEALKQTNSAEVRTAVANWIGGSGAA